MQKKDGLGTEHTHMQDYADIDEPLTARMDYRGEVSELAAVSGSQEAGGRRAIKS